MVYHCTKYFTRKTLFFQISFVISILFSFSGKAQVTYYSATSGNWNSPATWSTDVCGSGLNSATFPQTGDNAIICHNVTISSDVVIENVTINSGSKLAFEGTTSRTITVGGTLSVSSGGSFEYNNNNSLAHTAVINGNLENNGVIAGYTDVNDHIVFRFEGTNASVISGSGSWSLFNIIINKDSRAVEVEITTENFYNNLNSGSFTLTRGTYVHNNTSIFNMGTGNDYTINGNSIVRINQGTLNFASSAATLTLEGGLIIGGGTVNAGRTNGTGPNAGIRYRIGPGGTPFLTQTNGLLNVYQGIKQMNNTSPLNYTISGGITRLNSGTNVSSAETFKINDLPASSFIMSGGSIILKQSNSGGISDFDVGGTTGSVTSTGGTVQFGDVATVSDTFNFSPYANKILPNIKVTGPAATQVILKPVIAGNFSFISLYIDTGKIFESSSNFDVYENPTMTLTGTFDGNFAFFDNNSSTTLTFQYRSGTVVLLESSEIKVNTGGSLKRFFNLSCAFPGKTININNDLFIERQVIVNGGTLTSTSLKFIYLYHDLPLSITTGSVISVYALVYAAEDISQELPGYVYNCGIYIGGNLLKTINQMGPVTCEFFSYNFGNVNQTGTYLTNNHNLTINQDFTVGTGASTKLKEVRFGTSVVTIYGNLLIDKDGAVDAGSSTIYLHGNWTNRSTLSPLFKEDLSTLIMTGINDQTIENPVETERFYKMVIDKAYLDVTLKSTISIQSSLTFTSGRIFSSSASKLIFLTSSNSIGAKDGSFVHGPVQKNGAGDFDFPIGKDIYYKPMTISPAGPNTDVFTAEYFNTDPDPLYSTSSIGPGIASVSRCEYWSLVRNAGTTNTKVRLSYNSQSCYVSEYSTFKVLSWTGSLWKDEGRANFIGDGVRGSVESSAATTNYTAYTLMSCVPPVITVGGPLSFCSGDSVKLTAPLSEQYAWTNGSTAQSIFVKTSGAITVTTWKGVCTRTSPEVIVDVLSAPPLPDATPDTNCGPGSVTLVATNSPDGYRWYETPSGGSSVDSNANFITPILNSSVIYYVASISAAGCESTIRTAVEAIIHALPDIPVITSKINCGPGSVLLEATSSETKYAWYSNEDKTIVLSATGSTYTTPVLDTTTSYFVGAVTENNCESKPLVKVTVTIDSIPDRPKPFFAKRCGPGSMKLKITGNTAKYSWYTTKENGSPLEDSSVFVTPDLSENTIYFVAAKTNLGCESEERAEVNVYVNPIPEQPLINDTGRCGRGAMNIEVSGPANKINWYDKDSIFITNDSVLKIADLSSDSLFYVESITDSLCKSSQKAVTVFMYPIPGEPVVEDGSHCGPGDVLLKADGSDYKYIWYNESLTKIDSIETGELLLKHLISTTKFFVSSVSEKGCKSVEKDINAFIREIPATPEALPFSKCDSGDVTLYATGSLYKYGWFDADTTVVLSDSSVFRIPSVEKDTIFYVSSVTEFGCFSSKFPVPVEIKIPPADPVAMDGNRCGPGKVELSVVGSTTEFNWYKEEDVSPVRISGPLFLTDSINITTTYYVKNVSAENCESREKVIVKAVINEIPAMPDGDDVKRCGSGPISLSASGSAGDYLWYAADTTIDSLYSGPVFKIDSLYSSDTFYVASLSDKGCISEGRKAINATILPLPSAPLAKDDSSCGSGSLELGVNNSTGSFKWYETEAAVIAIDSLPNIVTPVLNSSRDYYVVAISSDRCESSPRTLVRAIINPFPSVPTAQDRTLCGADTLLLTASGSPFAYKWHVNDADLSETSAVLTTPVLNSSLSYFVSSVSSSECISEPREIKISYIDIPSVQTEEGLRCGAGSVDLKASGSAGNYYWYETLNSLVPIDTTQTFSTPVLSESRSYYVTTQTYETCKTKGRSEVKANIIAIPEMPEVEKAYTCGPGKITIKVKETSLQYYWYDENQNKLEEESFQFTTGDLSLDTRFYVAAVSQTCIGPQQQILARVYSIPEKAAASDISICENSTATLSASGSTGLYNWYEDEKTETPSATTQVFELPGLSESKTYYLAARDSFCISPLTPVFVDVKPSPESPKAVDGFSCGPGTVELSVTGNAVNYYWYTSQNTQNHFQDKSTSYTTRYLTADSTYFVAAVSEIGCQSNRVPVTATISETSIGGKTKPLGNTTVCGGSNGDFIELSGFKGSILRWESSSNNFATTPQAISINSEILFYSNIRSTTYYRAIVKSGACEEVSSSAVVINVVPSVVAGNIASNKTTVTKGSNVGEIILTGNVGENITWEWSLDTLNFIPTGVSSAIQPFENLTEDYYYRVKVASSTCGFKYTNKVKIIVKELPFLFIDSVTTTLNIPLKSEKSVLVNDYHPNNEPLVIPQPSEVATAAGGFIIIYQDGNFTYTPPKDYEGKDSASYFVCLANLDAPICANGKLLIRVKDETLKIFPTISPNGDNLNDEWIINNINLYPDNQVTIFDRWGNPVFEEKGYDNKNKVWKGRSNKNFVLGESELPEGTYFYVISLGANMKVRNGYIVLKR